MRGVGIAVAVLVMLAGCGGNESPSADEERVCGAVQQIVDDLAAQRTTSALAVLPELEAAVNATTNEPLASAGKQFFGELFTDIDYRDLTFEQTSALGRRHLASMASFLGVMLEECDAAGAEIVRLPQATNVPGPGE